jgi:hypothetical protein
MVFKTDDEIASTTNSFVKLNSLLFFMILDKHKLYIKIIEVHES